MASVLPAACHGHDGTVHAPPQAQVVQVGDCRHRPRRRDRAATVNRCSLIFISHDLSVVRVLRDRVLVMPPGRSRRGRGAELFSNPVQAYTRDLLDAPPLPDFDPGSAAAGG